MNFRATKTKKGELEEVSRQASEETKKRKAEIEARLREEEQQERIRHNKRKSSEAAAASTPSKVPNLRPEDLTTQGGTTAAFDYSQVDFKAVFQQGGVKSEEKRTGDEDFNPNRSKQQEKKRHGASKPKQRMKGGGGAGMTFNKK
jgi:hypothetical protein